MSEEKLTITEILHQEQKNLARYRRALREEDQLVFDDLWIAPYKHRSASKYAGHLLPFETFLLSMVIEEHKEVMQLRDLPREVTRLRGEVEFLRRKLTEVETAQRQWNFQVGHWISTPILNAG